MAHRSAASAEIDALAHLAHCRSCRASARRSAATLVRVLFSDHSSKDDLLRLLDVMVADSATRAAQMTQLAHRYLVDQGDFPRRAHINVMIVRFLVDFDEMVQHWAGWSREFIDTWPDTHERDADTNTLDQLRDAALPPAP